MASVRKVLGQLYPAADTQEDLYVVPAATSAAVSTLTICNIGTVEDTVTVLVAVGGEALAADQAIYCTLKVAPCDTFASTIGITLAATDVVRVKSVLGTSAFNLFGMEIT